MYIKCNLRYIKFQTDHGSNFWHLHVNIIQANRLSEISLVLGLHLELIIISNKIQCRHFFEIKKDVVLFSFYKCNIRAKSIFTIVFFINLI